MRKKKHFLLIFFPRTKLFDKIEFFLNSVWLRYGLRSWGHLSQVFQRYLSALKSSFRNFFTFLYKLLIILMQKNRYLVPMYWCIWPFEFLKYHDKVNSALERGVWRTISFYSYTPHVSYHFGNIGTQGGYICTLKPIWASCHYIGPP